MWLMSLSYQAFGITNFAARIWTPLFAASSLVTVFYLGKKLYNRFVGFASAIVLGTFTTFFMFAKAAMMDVPLVCFMLASIYFLLLSDKPKNTNWYAALGGVFFGLALMTKQVAALFIPAIIIIYWLTTKRSLRFLFTKRFALFVGIGLLIFAPWVILMYASFGSDFIQWFVMYTGVMRTLSPLEGHTGSPLFYFNYLVTNENILWVALLPVATGLCMFNAAKKRSKPDGLILIWIFLVLGVFTVAQTKISWYILPAYPAFALAIAAFLYELAEKFNIKSRLRLLMKSDK
jgi:4-amino-4-deoxy-L-arabinose transferase-like glycosyltransferase